MQWHGDLAPQDGAGGGVVMILGESTPVARTRHRCDWCSEFIEPGEKYQRYSAPFDGRMQTTKMHPECYAASLEWFQIEPHEDGFDYGAFKRGSMEAR
jgi:hypothetical protein